MSQDDFWESIADSLYPNWRESLQESKEADGNAGAGEAVRLYLINSKTLWVAGVEMAPADFVWARQQTAARASRALHLADAIERHIAALGQKAVKWDSPEASKAMGYLLAAMSNTQPLPASKPASAAVQGHWFFILYHLRDTSVFYRLNFLEEAEREILSADELLLVTRAMVRNDTSSGNSDVVKLMNSGGGADLHPFFTDKGAGSKARAGGGAGSLRPRPTHKAKKKR